MNRTRRMNQLTIAFLMAAALPFTAYAANHAGNMPDMKGMEGMQGMKGMQGMQGMQEAKPGQDALVAGEVKKVDAAQGKITLKHGPLDNLGMPGMTMVFRVADPAMLDKVKAGDMVKFRAEKVDGALTVTRLEK